MLEFVLIWYSANDIAAVRVGTETKHLAPVFAIAEGIAMLLPEPVGDSIDTTGLRLMSLTILSRWGVICMYLILRKKHLFKELLFIFLIKNFIYHFINV